MDNRKLLSILMICFALLVLFETVLMSAGASCPQDELLSQKANQNEKQGDKNNETQVEDDAIKLFLDKIEVMGELEKPQAVFIIPGVDPTIDDIKIDRSFFNEIFRPVEKMEKTKLVKKEETKDLHYLPW